MPFLPLPKEVEKETVTVNLETGLIAKLDRYREYLGRDSARRIGRDYIIAEALRIVFRKDKEFAQFLREHCGQESHLVDGTTSHSEPLADSLPEKATDWEPNPSAGRRGRAKTAEATTAAAQG